MKLSKSEVLKNLRFEEQVIYDLKLCIKNAIHPYSSMISIGHLTGMIHQIADELYYLGIGKNADTLELEALKESQKQSE